MKNKYFLIYIIFIFFLSLIGCDKYCKVTFDTTGGLNIEPVIVNKSSNVNLPNPTKEGYDFIGWFDANDISYDDNSIIEDNVTLYAKWHIKTFTVTYVDYDFSIIKTVDVNYGNSVTPPDNPSRNGYTFDCWDSDLTNITSDLIVKAEYSINQYAITFNTNGGTIVEPVTNINFNSLVDLPRPTKEGSIFRGWYDDNNFYYNNITLVNDNINLHASWELETYHVMFVDYDDKVLSIQQVKFGHSATPPSNPTRVGYTFSSWNKDFSNITNDLTITAIYNINKYSISFNSNGGNIIPTISDVIYDTVVNLPNPAKEYCVFRGWYDEIGNIYTNQTNINNNITLIAWWDPITYEVTFVDYDYSIIDSIVVNHGEDVIPPDYPNRIGYTFVGWNKELTNITSYIVVQALYQINKYTVTFESNGGSCENSINDIIYYTKITLPTPIKEGYYFIGWFDLYNTLYTDNLIITTNITLYAKWELKSFIVTFIDFDGIFIENQLIKYGHSASSPEQPTREGYTFVGWDTDISNITSDLIVKATYEIN